MQPANFYVDLIPTARVIYLLLLLAAVLSWPFLFKWTFGVQKARIQLLNLIRKLLYYIINMELKLVDQHQQPCAIA